MGTVVGLVGLLSACQHRESIAVADGRLSTDQSGLDFGPVELHARAIRHVKVFNLGLAAMQLTAVGSVGPDQDQFHGSTVLGQQLFSGEQATVDVVFSPSRAGPATAKLDILGEGATPQTVEVTLGGTGVDAQATITPNQLDFGKVEQQSSRTRLLAVENDSVLPTRVILAAEGPDAALLAVVPNLLELPAGSHSAVGVTWTPQATGALSAWVVALPCPWCEGQRIALTGQAIPDELIAVPASIDFGSIPKDFSVQRTVSLEN
ncbi:MAG: choice-of-anchor D domain-containing protein, partial [Deltaproteobacteria bacterium]